MMKVRLFNDGGFEGLKCLNFPMLIPAGYFEITEPDFVKVAANYLWRQGAIYHAHDIGDCNYYNFIYEEFEVIE